MGAAGVSPLVGLLVAWLAGSIPSAYLAGRARGVDLRTVGSGNLGATNVFRTLGAPMGIAVYVADMLKGFLPVAFLPAACGVAGDIRWTLAFAIAAIAGHVKPPLLLFRGGGKGVATASGAFLALAPLPMAIAIGTFAVVVAASGYVSLGSLVSALALVLAVVWHGDGGLPLLVTVTLVAAFVFWTHRANIARLRAGTEHRFGKRGKKAAPPTTEGTA
jgi:glycerol-3-phosphate acyltransferase PlsY